MTECLEIKSVEYSRRFLKSVRKIPSRIIDQAEKKIALFRNDPFHASLGTHKLIGKEREHWAFEINRSYRIKFVFLSDESVLFLDIGTHGIYE